MRHDLRVGQAEYAIEAVARATVSAEASGKAAGPHLALPTGSRGVTGGQKEALLGGVVGETLMPYVASPVDSPAVGAVGSVGMAACSAR